jgi:hypothetical protein
MILRPPTVSTSATRLAIASEAPSAASSAAGSTGAGVASRPTAGTAGARPAGGGLPGWSNRPIPLWQAAVVALVSYLWGRS